MKTIMFDFTQNIKEKSFKRIFHVFMLKEHTRNETEVFTVGSLNRVTSCIYFEKCNITVSVNFVTGWSSSFALLAVSFQFNFLDKKFKTKLAKV